MGGKQPFLLSVPMVSLYGACVGAVVLNGMRGRWGSTGWYPFAVGGVAVMAIIPLQLLLIQGLASAWGRAVFFFLVGALLLVGLPFLGRNDLPLICGLVAFSGVFLYAGVATCKKWPGFRPPPNPDACLNCGCEDIGDDRICAECGELVGAVYCPTCGYNLTDNESGVCPECGGEAE
jgi:hypothetical protein